MVRDRIFSEGEMSFNPPLRALVTCFDDHEVGVAA